MTTSPVHKTLAAAALLIALQTPGRGQDSIGWNYQGVGGTGLLSTDTAGATGFAQSNWNNHAGIGQGPGTIPLNDLVDGTGTATTLDVTAWSLSTNNSWQHNQTSTPDEILMNDFADKEPSLTFDQIPYTTNGYTVVVYYGNNEGPSTSTLTVGAQSRTITTGNTDQSSYGINGYLEGTDANDASPTNFSVFGGLTSATLSISLSGNNNNGISAIQFVEELATDPPGAPANPDPPDGAPDISVGKTLGWDDAIRADQYDIFLWPSSGSEPGTPTATVGSSGYDPPADLLSSTEYSWRVVARNTGSAATTNGPVWSFTTGSNLPPSAPESPSPADGASGVDPATTLDWADSARAATYNVYLWIPPATKPASPTGSTASSEFTPAGDLAQDTLYHWTVEAVNGDGTTPAADAFWSFTTLGPPAGAPDNPNPEHGSVAVSPATPLAWDGVANATSYNVRLWASTGTRPVDPTATTTATTYQPPALLGTSTGYSWGIEAVNLLGMTTGGPWTFSTASGVPGPRTIGWNLQGVSGTGLAADAIAGAPGYGQANWNNHASAGQAPGSPLSDLTDDTGSATTADVTSWTQTTNNSWQHNHTATPDEILTNDFADQEPAITFAEIPFSSYDVVVYYGNNEGPSTSTLTVGAQSRTITTGNTAASSVRSVGYVEGTDDNTDDPSNFSVFRDLSGAGLTVSLTGSNNNGLSAIQIVQADEELFEITGFVLGGGAPVVTFTSVPGGVYGIDRSTDLAFWVNLSDDTTAGGVSTDYTDTTLADDLPGATEVFYRVRRLE